MQKESEENPSSWIPPSKTIFKAMLQGCIAGLVGCGFSAYVGATGEGRRDVASIFGRSVAVLLGITSGLCVDELLKRIEMTYSKIVKKDEKKPLAYSVMPSFFSKNLS